jgi:hypothetical protein
VKSLISVLRFVNIVSAGVLGGGQLLVLRVIVPVKREWSTDLSVRVHQAMLHDLPDSYLLPAGAISGVTGALLLLFQRNRTALGTLCYLLGLVGSAGVAVTSERFNKPTNRMILGWRPEDIPANYPQIRDRWDRVHAVRTASGMLSFLAYLVAGLSRGKS